MADYRSALSNAQAGYLPCRGPAEEHANLRVLVERMYPEVFSVAYAMLGCAADADMAAQEAFTLLMRQTQPVDPQQEMIERLYRFAVSYCVSELRWRRVRGLFRWFPVGKPVKGLSTSSTEERSGRTVALALLVALSPKQRALLVLREVADQPVEAVARIMKMRASAVRRSLVSARRGLLKQRCPK